MPANLTIREDGTAEMFSGNNEVPWHQLGRVVSGTVTAAEAIKLAQMDWTVRKVPVFVDIDGEMKLVEKNKGIIRNDNKLPLAIVKGRYCPIQNEEAFTFFDEIVGSGQAVYETAGTLDEGRQIWIMAKLPDTVYLNPKDKHDKWAMLCSSHDGSRSVWMQLVSVRVVCQNTLSIALAGATNQIKIRHTVNYKTRKEEAQRTLDIAAGYFNRLDLVLKRLNEIPCPEPLARTYTENLFPATEDEKTGILKVSTRTQNIRDSVMALYQRGRGNFGQTRYDFLNGVAEYVSHGRTSRGEIEQERAENRFESVMMGGGAALNQRTFDLVTSDLNLNDFKS